MEDKVEASKFVINIGGEAKELTVEQFEELHAICGEILGVNSAMRLFAGEPVNVPANVFNKERAHWSVGLRSDGIPEHGMIVISHASE